jgi:hypothetical protein
MTIWPLFSFLRSFCNVWGLFCIIWGLFIFFGGIFLGEKPWGHFCFFWGSFYIFWGKKSGGNFVFFGVIFGFS